MNTTRTQQTRDGYTRAEAETYYHNAYEAAYTPLDGNDSVAFRTPPDIEEILGSSLNRWTLGGIVRRAERDARSNAHRGW